MLISPETKVIALHLRCWQCRSIFIQIFMVGFENACILKHCVMAVQGHLRSMISALIESEYATSYCCWLPWRWSGRGAQPVCAGCELWADRSGGWFSDDSALEVCIHETRYTNRRSYLFLSPIVNLVVSCPFSEILQVFCWKQHPIQGHSRSCILGPVERWQGTK